MCVVDWGLIADWITALTGIAVLIVAIYGLRTWREQLQGTTRHATAHEVATAARALKYAFYAARSPMIDGWEFPETYWRRGVSASRSHDEEADAYQHVYQNRLKELWPYLRGLLDLRPKCGAVLGDDAAQGIHNLVAKARELQYYMQERVAELRAGPAVVAKWSDQAFVQKVRASVVVSTPPNDTYSHEFETALSSVLEQLKPHQ